MTSRQTGRRLSTIAAEKKRRAGFQQTGRRRAAAAAQKERQSLGRLVVCSLAFVLLVAGKLLLPEKIAELDRRLSAALERNIDVQAVFSAVGRAISGQEDLSETAGTVYRAVFRPEEAEAVETAVRGELETVDTAAIDTLRSYRPEPAVQEEAGDGPAAPPQASTLAYILYSDENLPKSVSLEQAILGFDYCTPVAGVVSSGFGYREHPVEGEERFHYGIDLAADTGAEVRCFADGTVTAVGESSSYGKYCIVEHEGGFSTLYAHCSRITASSGAAVSGGGKIAEVGETGIATGPHLHFELQKDGKYLNPIYYLSPL